MKRFLVFIVVFLAISSIANAQQQQPRRPSSQWGNESSPQSMESQRKQYEAEAEYWRDQERMWNAKRSAMEAQRRAQEAQARANGYSYNNGYYYGNGGRYGRRYYNGGSPPVHVSGYASSSGGGATISGRNAHISFSSGGGVHGGVHVPGFSFSW